MKRIGWMLCLAPLLAVAGPREDYAHQWPLQLGDAQAGAYRVVLDAGVYRQLQSPALRDLDVIDARAGTVPAVLFGPDEPAVGAVRTQDLPWFALPPTDQARDVAAISELATDGSLRRVEWRSGTTAQTSGFLIDASRVEEAIHGLRLRWDATAPVDLALRVEASDDLRDWQLLEPNARVVDLRNQGARVLRDRIDFAPTRARYLRLTPANALRQDFRLDGVQAQRVSAVALPDWQWEALRGRAVTDAQGKPHYEFELSGRFPVARADVALPGNSTQEWRLESRDRVDAPWRWAAGPWLAFRVRTQGSEDASPPQMLDVPNRDRYGRLTPLRGSGAEVPELRLGWRPEVLIFVAQGEAPYTLVAGSQRAVRADAAVVPMMAAIRAQRGAQWQPAIATLGREAALAGDAALVARPAERDWKAWLLWALLGVGALLVAGFAVSLMRKPTPD